MKKMKIFGVGAAVLMILIALSPTFLATSENHQINDGGEGGNNGQGEITPDPQECEWQVEITDTHDKNFKYLPTKIDALYRTTTQTGYLGLTSNGAKVSGDAHVYDFAPCTSATLAGSVSSTKHIHIYRECPEGVPDDCCYQVKVIMKPRFKLKVEVSGNAHAVAGGYFQIVTPECSVSEGEAIAVGNVEPSQISPTIGKDPSVTFHITVAPGDSEEIPVSAVEICTIESCDVDIIALGAGYLSVTANGIFMRANANAEIFDWDLDIEILTKCDCEQGGEWTPLLTIGGDSERE